MNKIQAVTVILKEYPADRKVTVIKVIREITGLGLKEAKDLVEGVPSVIKRAVSKADAQDIKQRLEDLDAVVDVEVTPESKPAEDAAGESNIPTLQEVRTALEGAFESLDTHVAALEMACHALKNTESEGDPERIAKVFNEVIIPHLREQVYDTLNEFAERIPATQESQP